MVGVELVVVGLMMVVNGDYGVGIGNGVIVD